LSLRIAVLGATGLVGREILNTLAERTFPASDVIAVASRKSMGKEVSFGDRTLKARDVDGVDFSQIDVCFLAVGERSARKWAPKIAAEGCIAIDVSPAFRLDADVPLVAPEANAATLSGWRARRIIAAPGGVAAQLAAALKPLHEAAGLRRVIVSTYQSVSEQGLRAMDELFTQTKGVFVNQAMEHRELPRQIAFNVIPQAGEFRDDGSTDDEYMIAGELKKILGEEIAVSATCVLVPTFASHAAAVHVELERPFSPEEARALLRESPGLMVIDRRDEEGGYVTPVEAAGEWAVYVSRIRADAALPNGLALWVVADNLRKAGALNPVQIAELLNEQGAFADRVKG
jgi:aspartate-semialdehyde dehydrogenase